MKIRDLIHNDTAIYKILPLWARILLDHVHEIQTKVDLLMVEYEATKSQVATNTAYVAKKKYVTPYGDFSTYREAAEAEPNQVSWTELRRWIKDENQAEYYLNV